MEATGVIFAALDCDHDAIESWNRWYDLEHLPPNVALDGVVQGRRYVAPPELQARRVAVPGSPYADGLTVFATMYTLTGDPELALDRMTDLREELVAKDRMFAEEKKAVREGGVYRLSWVVADPVLRVVDRDVPYIEHTGFLMVQRAKETAVDAWYRRTFAPEAVAVPGVSAVLDFESVHRPDVALDLVLFDRDAADCTDQLRSQVTHHPDAGVVVEAPFRRIDPLCYPWADDIRRSGRRPSVV